MLVSTLPKMNSVRTAARHLQQEREQSRQVTKMSRRARIRRCARKTATDELGASAVSVLIAAPSGQVDEHVLELGVPMDKIRDVRHPTSPSTLSTVGKHDGGSYAVYKRNWLPPGHRGRAASPRRPYPGALPGMLAAFPGHSAG